MKTFKHLIAAVAVASTVVTSPQADAASYQLPRDKTDVVGYPMTYKAKRRDTFSAISQRFDVPYLVLLAANPGVDPWAPGVGTEVKLPTQIILPKAPRAGIVINVAELRLYYYPPTGDRVEVFPIGIGRVGWTTPIGSTSVTKKKKDPTWTPPASIRREHAAKGRILPPVVPAGPKNPLGRYAMRLGFNGAYLIHGTNKNFGVGMRVSHGCIRMYPEDIEHLFSMVSVGTKVTIVNQPYKVGTRHGLLYAEAHEPLSDDRYHRSLSVNAVTRSLLTKYRNYPVDITSLKTMIRRNDGIANSIEVTPMNQGYAQVSNGGARSERAPRSNWPANPW